MLGVGGLEYHRAFVRLVDGIFLCDLHGGQNLAVVRVDQCDISSLS